MAEQKRFYWLKLKDDFFQSHTIRILEGMPNGKEYAYFLLKLMAESISHEGRLRVSEAIPYNEEMLSSLTNTNIDIVRSAIKAFEALGVLEIMDDGTYFFTQVQKMIGSAVDNDNANRQRRFREREKEKSLLMDNASVTQDVQENYASVTNRNERLENRDKRLDIDIEKETRKKDCSAIVSYLNEKLGTQYRANGKTSELIGARMKEGYEVEDFQKVIDNMVSEWLGDEKMEQYLRPSTLFSKTHFPEYLNRKPKQQKKTSKNPWADIKQPDLDFSCDFD